MTFGHLPVGDNPLTDKRVRQALSRAFDRDLDIEVHYNVDEFRKEGLPVSTRWNSHLAARDSFVSGDWFLDPQGSDFGPNAVNFQYDVAEAKKLLAAAGFADGFELEFRYPAAPGFNRSTQVEPLFFYFQEIGITVNQNGQTDYTQGYIPQNRDASGEYPGIGYHSITGGVPSLVSPTSALVAEHLPSSGITFHGYDSAGTGDKSGDSVLIQILEKARLERDVETRKRLVKDAQRHLGGEMHMLPGSGGASTFWMAWPSVENFRVFEGDQLTWLRNIWLNQEKAPFG